MTPNSPASFALSTLSSPSRGASVLDRLHRPSLNSASAITPLQSQVDGLVGSFVAHATDGRSLAAMTLGGMAYRMGRIGIMSLGSGNILRAASVGIGLSAEVVTFEGAHRGLSALSGDLHSNPNLLRWNGSGGIRQGLLQSFITFGTLKGAGRLASGENVLVQHLAQDSAMVLGHNTAAAFGIAPRPTESLAEQFLHAEATNLQIGAGMAVVHRMSPGVHGLERGLDLSLRNSGSDSVPRFQIGEGGWVLAAARAVPESSAPRDPSERISGIQISQMAGPKGSRGSSKSPRSRSGVAAPTASTERVDRARAKGELEAVTGELEALHHEVEKSLDGMRILLHQNRKSAEHWEIYDRLLLRHSTISRKHQIGATALVPGGGAEKWPIPRLEQAVSSLRRALVDSRSFYENLNLPPLPEVPDRPIGAHSKSWEETIRMFRQSGIDSALAKRLLKNVVPEARRGDSMVLHGLEGLHGLINERPKDEYQAVIGLLESIINGNGSGFEMLRQLLVVTMHFHAGLLSRSEVMEVIRDARDFHQAYPEARGPFLELFTRRVLQGSRQAILVPPLLNFARDHLEQKEWVVLEPRTTIHQGVFMTESPAGERARYAAGGILKEVRSYFQVEAFAEILAADLVKAWEADSQKTLQQGLYIEALRLNHDIEPERLRFWGRLVLERAVPLALKAVIETSVEELLARNDIKDDRNWDVHMALRLLNEINPEAGRRLMDLVEKHDTATGDFRASLRDSLSHYWNAFHIALDRIEIAYGNNPRRRQVVRVEANEPGSEAMILQLQQEVHRMKPNDPALPRKALLLAQFLCDVGRRNEAVEFLVAQLRGQPHKRIREFYRDLFQDALEEIFPSTPEAPAAVYSLQSEQILEFLHVFFDTNLSLKSLEKILTLRHPNYEIGQIGAERNADALRLTLPILKISSLEPETIGEFILDLNLPQNESKLIAQLSRAEIYPDDQGRSTAPFVMDRIFKFLQALKITELRVEADDIGRYAWLRMGGEFLRDEDRVRAGTLLQAADLSLPPGFTARSAPTPLIAAILASLPRREREELMGRWPGSPVYRWSLLPDSPELLRFQQYFEPKMKTAQPSGAVN